MSYRESVLAALFARLQTIPGATVRRNQPLPTSVPVGGLVIMRDGDPGEPDVTLNPRTEYYTHGVEVEALLTLPLSGDGATALDTLATAVATALAGDRGLGGLAENMTLGAPMTSTVAIEGAAPILAAAMTLIVEYQIDDPLDS